MAKTTRKIEVAPSILSADFAHLGREVKAAQDAGADRIHCDIMDGNFVPNITFGPLVVEAVRKSVTIPLDVHLMIGNPEKYLDDFCRAGANTLIVHAESCPDLPDTAAAIRKHKVRPGVTVNPEQPVSLFLDHLGLFDQALIMTVHAGFGGQKFIPETLAKISEVHTKAAALGRAVDIEVDGGINGETACECARHGANVFVAGYFVFKSPDYAASIRTIREAAEKGVKASTVLAKGTRLGRGWAPALQD
ncbi:MAG: ribulose-phosphate 3-epimerase [Chitinispirillaceae bacterium]|nr:ribulose-phosphate 3-epimerase [Chitinispirillaceae bacterium]